MRNQSVLVLCAAVIAAAVFVAPPAWAAEPSVDGPSVGGPSVDEPSVDEPGPILEIVGGVRATAGDHPWVVRLSTGCAGTLTAPRYVLTAAHCVDGTGPDTEIRVTAGVTDLRSPDAVVVWSRQVRQAPGFRRVTSGDDWAVIELERELDLPTLPLAVDATSERGAFTVVGWGTTDEISLTQRRHLRVAEVSYVDDDTCGAAYDDAGYGFVPDDMICAGNVHSDGPDACQGDSGGPMVGRDETGQRVQVGIVSWGHGCARDGYPGVYAQVSTFAAEILRTIAPDVSTGETAVSTGETARKLVPRGM